MIPNTLNISYRTIRITTVSNPMNLIAQSVQLCLQQEAVTDVNGFRLLDNRYLVAVGTFCNAPCGTYIDLILENGVLIPCLSVISRPTFIPMKRIHIPWLRCARVSLLWMIRYARLHVTGMYRWCMRSGGRRLWGLGCIQKLFKRINV